MRPAEDVAEWLIPNRGTGVRLGKDMTVTSYFIRSYRSNAKKL